MRPAAKVEMAFSVEFFPLLPVSWLVAFAIAATLVLAAILVRRTRGVFLRALAIACFFAALLNPSLRQEDRKPLSNIAIVAVDESSSMQLAGRQQRADEVERDVRARLGAIPNLEVRTVRVKGDEQPNGEETNLLAGIDAATADVPQNRIAGVIAITDGQVHDAQARTSRSGRGTPFHALIVGRENEKDNRIEIVSAPRFGLVGSEQTVEVRAEQSGGSGGFATFEVRRDSNPPQTLTAQFGQTVRIPFRFDHAGANVMEVSLRPEPGELTLINNKAVVQAQGIRENLRVLLVSGEPHAGERTWRNLMRADASVDLVHFTILRPPEKHDGTPIDQLSLIAFPTRELFSEKLNQFDLVIFDRYQRRAVLPMIYLDNVARYVEQGGAVLVAAGADFAAPSSLARTPLGTILPAFPTGRVVEEPFRPLVTEAGQRHPVTAGLSGANRTAGSEPRWGRWFRVVDSQPDRGQIVMTGPEEKPLLILDKRGKGRLALLLSDHAWLWARGYDGGGPHVDLLRRLAHWLMKEPELEEEALTAQAGKTTITIERRSMKEQPGEVTVTSPSGEETRVRLEPQTGGSGRFAARVTVTEQGVYRLSSDQLRAVVVVGQMNSPEFRRVVATRDALQPLLAESGGGAFFTGGTAGAAALSTPTFSMLRGANRYYGETWLGLKARDAYDVTATSYIPLVNGFLALGIGLLALSLTWYREGR
jgi:hypothetical protein